MATPNSWTDEVDDNQASGPEQITQGVAQMSTNPNFNPNAGLRAGAAAFTPNFGGGGGGGGYNQQQQQWGQQQQQYGQQQYQQYQQYGYGGGYPQYQQYGYQNQNQNQQQYQQYQQPQQQFQQPPPANAQRDQQPSAPKASQASTAAPAASSAAPPKPNVAKAAKVLSIGVPAAKPAEKTEKPAASKSAEAGAKVAASKAIDKSDSKMSASNSGKNSPSRAADTPAARKDADEVLKEQAADVDETLLADMYGKEHVNVIFLGHVDAGKSTLGGSILYATGMIDERTLDKYKREAKELGRDTWYLSWALDLTKEERAKGKTVEVGRGFFETEKRRYSILDAPGHKTFVPNMIGGASQADVGVLVISSRKGEYETGYGAFFTRSMITFEKGGQTREHAMLAKTQGVNKLLVVVNKMDDPTVEWSEERYKECTGKLTVFLKGLGYNPKSDLIFLPISAQTGINIKDRIPDGVCPWYSGPSLLEVLDNMKALERKVSAPFMMPISAKFKDLGTMVEGKIEAGVIKKDSSLMIMPNKEKVSVAALYGETEDEVTQLVAGEQARIRLRGVEEEDILPGFVLCHPSRPVNMVQEFECQLVLLELRSIFSVGYGSVMHCHSLQEEVVVSALLHKLEPKTNRKSKRAPGFATKGMAVIARLKVIGSNAICVERFEDYPQMGRFTLRDQGTTIAIGKITKLITDSD